ncbi:MAG: hypothetical protein EOP24_26200 [Hyphomicrobiales bacterium]|nr:MAG: hypothetical protein EOP24_26200 [Hyphomicrobiales bacterium]
MARPRPNPNDPTSGKKTEPFVIRVTEAEAMAIYREAASRDLPPAVLLRRFVRLGMAASSPSNRADDNESSSDFASLGDS